MRISMLAVLGMAVLARGAFGHGEQTSTCEHLAQLTLSNAKVTSAGTVAAGAFPPPAVMNPRQAGVAEFYKRVPEFCRVQVTATPSADSDVKIEVWLPTSGWNGRFEGVGNGGFAGNIDHAALALAVKGGYATAATDTGHTGTPVDATWAPGHPEKMTDFGYRAIHEMTKVGKEMTKALYGREARRAYFGSCSNGGRQALMEVQRFPEDYDGVIAGAPANYWSHLLANSIYNAQATTMPAENYIPASKLSAIAEAVNQACDAQDGVKDGVLNDPRQCRFDPGTLLCKAEESDKCLTKAQVSTLKKLYRGGKDSHGKRIFPGYLPGAEEGPGGWGLWITGQKPGQSLIFAFGVGFFSNMVYAKPGWDYQTANIDELETAADNVAHTFNATDANLAPFQKRGGKLILYHGWNDAAISALNTMDYYESVRHTMGAATTESFVRVYMVPGMQHCAGGPGAYAFGEPGMEAPNDPRKNMRLALEKWVENGTAPGELIGTKYVEDDEKKGVKMTRLLCSYPQTAKYKGSGDTNDAANFVCESKK
jgi:hypothetical protein